jgi:lariat debranching enzyme
MNIPPKFLRMGDFMHYHSGNRIAPVLTLFVGGNHEASAFMRELPYGGWVAPNIFYMGASNVMRFGNLTIGGVSGIFKHGDYLRRMYASESIFF